MPNETRRSLRIACLLDALLGEDRLVFQPPMLVKVGNISTVGVGIHSPAPFEIGTDLTIKLCADSPGSLPPRRARVVRATEQPNRTWMVGVEFVHALTEAEFHTLLLRRVASVSELADSH